MSIVDRPRRWTCIRFDHFEHWRLCRAGGRSLRGRDCFINWALNYRKSRLPSQTMYRRRDLATRSSIAGTGPRNQDGSPQGKVGRDVTLDEAKQHARNVGLQLLAALRDEIGSLDKVVRFGRVFGMVNAVPDFADHPKVINGCSDLFVEVFGDRGRHARCAVGMGSLPFNMTVEIEALVEVV